ncbi:MAG: sigma-70 family RNA polymerase sigma factor [Nocardioides sp.]
MTVTTYSDGSTLVGRATTAFAAYLDGDRPALDTLVETMTPLLWRTVRETGLDTATAEDVVQTVWLSLLRKADTVRDPATIVKWLLTTARREAWRVSKRVRGDASRSGGVLGVDIEETLDLPRQREALPDEIVFRSSDERRLWEHVQLLPARCRQLISVIAFADRPDYSHIAESLGMPIGSIGPTRGRCLAKLRAQLASDTEWEGTQS